MLASKIFSDAVIAFCMMSTIAHTFGERGLDNLELMKRQDTMTGRPNQFNQLPNSQDVDLATLIKNELTQANVLPEGQEKQQGLIQEIINTVKKRGQGRSSNDSKSSSSEKDAVKEIVQALMKLNKNGKNIQKRQAKSDPPESVLKAKILAALIRRNLLPKDSAKATDLIEEARTI
ncbi:hypothetical protein K7432_015073 [Basidiobolus ranarum]|uniref:Uncharacterized protein n=1 Tax=Basidiobolus ranarum TaxID=34480 RepID=A0ABR2WGQ5_9FUNG